MSGMTQPYTVSLVKQQNGSRSTVNPECETGAPAQVVQGQRQTHMGRHYEKS